MGLSCSSARFFLLTAVVHSQCAPLVLLISTALIPLNSRSISNINLENASHIIGSVNGLICFCYRSSLDNYVIHIWNPSLSAVFTLPPCPSVPHHLHFGFGFDPKTQDYKVVMLTHISNMVQQCGVYSMRKGSWEPISQSFPPHTTICTLHNNPVCVADRLHWLGGTNAIWMPTTIVAFDLGGEAFIEMSLPDSIRHQIEYRLDVLGVLAGKLCVMSCYRDGGECVVWLMGEYGVAGSWVKHHVFPPFSGDIIPHRFTLQNEFLFQVDEDDERFGLYDPVAAKTKTFWIMSIDIFSCRVVEYVDSLVWIQHATNRLQI